MSQPKPHVCYENDRQNLEDPTISIESESNFASVIISTAKTKKTAYKRAATKLRQLADEAERLADE